MLIPTYVIETITKVSFLRCFMIYCKQNNNKSVTFNNTSIPPNDYCFLINDVLLYTLTIISLLVIYISLNVQREAHLLSLITEVHKAVKQKRELSILLKPRFAGDIWQ